jgi:hypothetical protein
MFFHHHQVKHWDRSLMPLWESLTSRSQYRDSSQSSKAIARFSMAVTVVQ